MKANNGNLTDGHINQLCYTQHSPFSTFSGSCKITLVTKTEFNQMWVKDLVFT